VVAQGGIRASDTALRYHWTGHGLYIPAFRKRNATHPR
jgi:hypothetical protein